MDIAGYNRRAWDRQVAKGNRWTVPVGPDVIAAARRGDWTILLTGLNEDHDPTHPLSKFIPAFVATRAVKPGTVPDLPPRGR